MRGTGEPIDPPAGVSGPDRSLGASRRLVTVLFADVVGSTTIGERLDPEGFGAFQARLFAAIRPAIERHGGTLEKFIGDAVMAVFGVPTVHEDDALRAVRAALELAPALAPLDEQLRRVASGRLQLRIGLHSGEVLATGGTDTLVSGDVVNVAARLQALAEPDTIVFSRETRALLGQAVEARDLGDVAIRGRERGVGLHALVRLTGLDARAHLDAPFVGRDRELAALEDALSEATAGSTRLVTVLGPPGVGKSRLVGQLLSRMAGQVTVVSGRCLSYGDGTTWWPLLAILRQAAGTPDDAPANEVVAALGALIGDRSETAEILAVIASVLGSGRRESLPDDIGWAMRRILAGLSERQTVICLVDDIHWAEPPLLDLLEALVEWSSDLRLLIVCPARPELHESRPGWGATSPAMTTITLNTLDDTAARALLDSLPGGSVIPEAFAERILGSAEGNALFLEEFIAHLRDRAILREDGAGWRFDGDPSVIDVPATVTAIVSARIDGLPAAQRHVAMAGAVIGRTFERTSVLALGPELGPTGVSSALLGLNRRAIVSLARIADGRDEVVRFRHILLRDAAYARLPKAERAAHHLRFATWLAARTGGVAEPDAVGDELAEVLAHHVATAAEIRLELDPLDEALPPLIRDADDRLRRAIARASRLHAWSEVGHLGDRLIALLRRAGTLSDRDWLELTRQTADAAFTSGAVHQGIAVLRGALTEPPARDPRVRASLLERFALGCRQIGDDRGAFEALEEALAGLGPDDRHDRAMVLAMRGRLRLILREDHTGAVKDTEAVLETAGDADGERWYAAAIVTLATALGDLGDEAEWEGLFDWGLRLAERSGDADTILRAHGNRTVVYSRRGDGVRDREWLHRGIARADELGMARSLPGRLLRHNAVQSAFRGGRLAEARRRIDELRGMSPTGQAALQLAIDEGVLALLSGDDDAAARLLDVAEALAKRIGSRASRSEIQGHRAVLDWLRGDRDGVARAFSDALAETDGALPRDGYGAGGVLWAWTADAADRARSGDVTDPPLDRDGPAASLDAVATHLRAALALTAVDRWNAAQFRLALGEHARAVGVDEVPTWKATAEQLEREGCAWHAIHARTRLAEALIEVDADPAAIAAAVEDAAGAARAIGAAGLLRRVEALRSSGRVPDGP